MLGARSPASSTRLRRRRSSSRGAPPRRSTSIAYAWGLDNLGPGDVVVITELEHHANFVPWQYIAHRTGASFRSIPIDDVGELQLDSLDSLAREGNVKVVANNLVSNTLGTINPVETLAAWAHDQGAIMVVDAAQAAPHRRVDVQALGADFVAISLAQALRPEWGRRALGRSELLEAMSPFNLGGEMIRSVALDRDDLQRAAVQVRGRHACDRRGRRLRRRGRLHLGGRAGGDRAPTSTRSSSRRWRRWDEIPWIRVFGPPPDRRAGIVSFDVEGIHPHDVAQILDWEGVAVRAGHHCTQPLMTRLGVSATTRASFYLYSIPEEIDRLDRRPPQGQGVARADERVRAAVSGSDSRLLQGAAEHGVLEPHDAIAEGQNPLCGDEMTVSVRFGEGDVIEDVGFEGRGCAISQAATSMLTESSPAGPRRRSPDAEEDLLDEIGIPLTPVRLKCALLGLGVLRSRSTAPRGRRSPTSGAHRRARSRSTHGGGRGGPARGAADG